MITGETAKRDLLATKRDLLASIRDLLATKERWMITGALPIYVCRRAWTFSYINA